VCTVWRATYWWDAIRYIFGLDTQNSCLSPQFKTKFSTFFHWFWSHYSAGLTNAPWERSQATLAQTTSNQITSAQTKRFWQALPPLKSSSVRSATLIGILTLTPSLSTTALPARGVFEKWITIASSRTTVLEETTVPSSSYSTSIFSSSPSTTPFSILERWGVLKMEWPHFKTYPSFSLGFLQ